MALKTNNTFCILPWVNLEVRPDGSMAACCVSRKSLTDGKSKLLHASQVPMTEAFNSPDLLLLRERLGKGIQDSNCKACWHHEELGVLSRRQKFNLHFKDEVQILEKSGRPFDNPINLDLKVSRKCNLKCRICGPASSSLWAEELRAPAGISSELWDQLGKTENAIFDWQNENFWSVIETWLSKIKRLEFFGGESLLIERNKWLMQRAVDLGVAHKIDINFSTNGTIWPNYMVTELFPHFKSVTMHFSIDGIEKHFEYQRHPAKWDKVQKNFLRMKEIEKTNKNLRVHLVLTVSSINIFYLAEYLQYWCDLGVEPGLNLVQSPEYFSLAAIPMEVRPVIRQKLIVFLQKNPAWVENPAFFILLRDFISADGKKTKFVFAKELWADFQRVILEYDQIRGEDFTAVFSAFSKMCPFS